MSIPILMPALSPTMEEGTLSKWFVKEGDKVSPGDVIAEIETDKATMEVEAVDEGVVKKLIVPEGTEKVKVRTPIAELDDAAPRPVAMPAREINTAAKPRAATPENVRVSPKAAKPAAAVQPAGDGERVFASPLARRLAEQRGVDLASVVGSGPRGRIVKADVEATPGFERRAPRAEAPKPAPAGEAVESQPTEPATAEAKTTEVARVGGELTRAEAIASLPYDPNEYVVAPLDGMRKTIARRMTHSVQEVPHFPLNVDIEMERLLQARKQLNARLEHENIKLSINDILIRACALALKKVPDSNVSYVDGALLRHKHAHVAVAVAIAGGLITPVIFHAEQKGLAEISREMTTLGEKARARKLLPHEYEGGTFTISNLGMYGIKSFSSILNEPQAMILSVGAGEERPVARNGQVVVANMASFTLTCDHRAIDGAIGAEYLNALRAFIEDPMMMML